MKTDHFRTSKDSTDI